MLGGLIDAHFVAVCALDMVGNVLGNSKGATDCLWKISSRASSRAAGEDAPLDIFHNLCVASFEFHSITAVRNILLRKMKLSLPAK